MSTTQRPRSFRRLLAGSVITGAAVAAFAGVASAHVVVTPDTDDAGSRSLLTFAFGHGCDGSPTTEVRIQIPESIPSVTPTINPGWDVTKVTEELPEPIEVGHSTITERVTEVVYTAKTPIEDGYRDTFVLSLTLPDAADEWMFFPTIQTCSEGETAWIEIPEAGQSGDDLDAPAPGFQLDEADDADSDH